MYQVMIYYKNHAHVKRWDTPQNFFLAFIDELWKTPKIRILKKEKKKKKKNAGDSIILHMCTKNHNQVQFLRYGVTQFFLSFRANFCPLAPPAKTPENQNFEKMKEASGDVIILNLRNKKYNQMMYAYSDMECDRHIFCHFRSFSALLPHYWPGKSKLGKK